MPKILTKIPKFRRCVLQNFPFIEEDFDALTDYQLLCKVVEYLNKVINSQNEVIEVAEELTASFNELQSFVENYFANLDVQEEINNKLDVMAEDGTLQEIITTYIQSNVAWTFDTVADMQQATNLVEGSYARTLGYTSLDDKMGGLYKITTVSSGNIPLNTSGLYAHHLKENAIVSIDDYDGATAEDRLYAALDDIASGTIIGGNITITKQYNAGAKDYRKIIVTNCNFDIQYNHWFDQNGSTLHTVPCFSNCVISGNGNTMFVGDYNAVGPSFNNCVFTNVCIYSSDANYIQSPYFINCQMYGVENLFTATTAYDFKMIGCRVESASGKLVVITSNPGLMQGAVTSCLIEGRTNVVFEISNIYSFSITGCYFEGCNGGVLSQTTSSGSAFVVIRGNSFFAPMNNTDYVINLATSAFQRANMSENITNLPNGKYLCNKNVQFYNILNRQNINYGNTETFKNDGFYTQGSTHAYDKLAYINSSATYDSDNSEWICKFKLKYGEAYSVVRPFLLTFVGSIGSSTQYRGYANILVTPRIGYANGAVSLLCDAKILDACNTTGATPSSTVTVSVDPSSSSPSANGVEITVKIGGFTSSSGQYRVLDMFQIISAEHLTMNI